MGSGPKSLVQRVLDEACMDAVAPVPPSGRQRKPGDTTIQEKAYAKAWVETRGNRGGALAFDECCRLLEIDAEALRRVIRTDPVKVWAILYEKRPVQTALR